MVSRSLTRKLRRDLWAHRWPFLAVALVIAIGIAVYVGASDAYANLQQSFDRAYTVQRLPDVILSGPDAGSLADRVRTLPGSPLVTQRQQADVGLRIGGHSLMGRVVALPATGQPDVSRLSLRAGALPQAGEVVVEQHVADHYRLRPGDAVELMTAGGWRTWRVSGSALSTEYFWPAASRQEILTTPEHFGVVFAVQSDLALLQATPLDQLLVYVTDRGRAAETVSAVDELAGPALSVTVRDDQPSYRALQDDVSSIGQFATLLPWLFLLAAVFGTYVLLSRLVAAQRAVIGTMAANGLPASRIRTHYVSYGLVAAGLGIPPGLLGGYVIGGWFTSSYTDALGLPLRVVSLHPQNLVVGAAVGLLAAVVAAWAPARAAGRVTPAEAMRVVPPTGSGRLSVLERLFPAVNRLPARWRMALRGLARNRRRSVMTVTGVAVAVILVMVFAGLADTVASVVDRQFSVIQAEDAQLVTAPGAAAAVASRLRADTDVRAAEVFARNGVSIEHGGRVEESLLVAYEPGTTMHRFLSNGRTIPLPGDGVLLGIGARRLLDVREGDEVLLRLTGTTAAVTEKVVGFVDEPMSAVAYLSLTHLASHPGLPGPGGVMLRLAPGADQEALSARTTSSQDVVAYLSTSSLAVAMREAFSLFDALVGLSLVFAALLAAALLYTVMSANVAERTSELGTLQAEGMPAGRLRRLVAAENLTLVVIAIPVGLLLGVWAADWFLSLYETQGYVWDLSLRPTTLPLVVGVVLAAAALSQWPAQSAIGRMDLARIVRERSL